MSFKITTTFIVLALALNCALCQAPPRPPPNNGQGQQMQPPNGSMPPPHNPNMTPPKVSNNYTHVLLTFPDGNKMALPLLPLNQVRVPPMMGMPPPPPSTNNSMPRPPMNGSMNMPNPQQQPPQGPQAQAPFTYLNNGSHIIFKLQNGQTDYYKLNSVITRAATLPDLNTLLNLLTVGQLSQQLQNLITSYGLDSATAQQLIQLAQLFVKDPMNFWVNNWSAVLTIISKLPQGFLTQLQGLLAPRASINMLSINSLLNILTMGQFDQALSSLINNSGIDAITKQKLIDLGAQLTKDPANFIQNNWADILMVISKLPQDFLTQLQSLLMPKQP